MTGRRAPARSSRSGPEGVTEVWTRESIDFPNGLAVSPDGRELWVLESTPGRLVRFAIRPDGTAGSREVLVELPGTVPDGIAFAADGSVVIACYRPDVVLRWRADLGVQILAADSEGTALAAPTNCVFYGPDLASIAVPNLGRWHVTRFTRARAIRRSAVLPHGCATRRVTTQEGSTMGEFDGRSVLVTGGALGIGRGHRADLRP